MVTTNPYQDTAHGHRKFSRTFRSDVDVSELVWHRDHHTRKVKVVSGDGWSLQLDNCMPVPLTQGSDIEIPSGVYHRIHRGHTDLVLDIEELHIENKGGVNTTLEQSIKPGESYS